MDDEDEPRIEFTDEEWVFLRHVRFGELPPRLRTDELVELQETEPGGAHLDPNQRNWRDLSTGWA